MSTASAFEPSPFDGDDGDELVPARPPRRKPGEPFEPLSAEDLDRIAKTPAHLRYIDPWRCAFDTASPDGSPGGAGYGRTGIRQCRTRLADPTKSRYCYEHATELGVAYSPEETVQVIAAESTANLQRLVPKAVRTLELVMEDNDAPPGIRAKAADSVLDRTGHAKGLDVFVEAKVTVDDPLSVLRDRLTDLREAQMEAAKHLTSEDDIVDGEVIETEPTAIEAPPAD